MEKKNKTKQNIIYKFLFSMVMCFSLLLTGVVLTGCSGKAGPQGEPGKSGVTWYTGTENPKIVAQVGDFYFETDENNIWQFKEYGWVVVFRLSGSQGAEGGQGDEGQ